jgi:hypothetical protein
MEMMINYIQINKVNQALNQENKFANIKNKNQLIKKM